MQSLLRLTKVVPQEIVTVSGSGTLIEVLCNHSYEEAIFEITNTGAHALDAFSVDYKAHADGSYITVQSSGFTTATNVVPYCSADVTTLAATTGKALIALKLYRCYSFRFQASANTAADTIISLFGACTGWNIEIDRDGVENGSKQMS